MAAMLQHRGPDGYGFYRDRQAGLAHTRLSLVDLAGGAQPLHNEDETIWLVGNGEVFDHRRWRSELEARGHRFGTHSDLEVLLHGFEEWGEEVFARVDAQFAVAIWDARARRLALARDRFGILPMHFAETADGLVFASEQKALFAGGRLAAELDPDAVRQVFTLWSAPGPRTVFAGVRIVPPATCITFPIDGAAREHAWWRPDCRVGKTGTTLESATDELEHRLEEAVRIRLQADVPVAAYVSGGLDSSVLVALAARAGTRPITFSLAFDDPAFDESAAQQRVAALFGGEHHEVRVTDADIRAQLSDVVWHCETPLLRTAPVPMFALSGLVRERGIKAVLTGEGADELLAGYSTFQEDKVRRFVARHPGSEWRSRLFARVHDFVATSSRRDSAMWRAFLTGAEIGEDPFASHRVRWRNGAWTSGVLDIPPADSQVDDAAIEALLPARECRGSPLARAQLVEIATFMTPYLLSSQGDRVAMGHGVEARYPFLAPGVIQHCLGLPDRVKLCGMVTKVALRHLGSRLLPEDVHRRKKHPYRAPIARALLESGRDDLLAALTTDEAMQRNPLLAPQARMLVGKLRRAPERAGERESMALCGVFTLQLLRWHFLERFSEHVELRLASLLLRAPQVDVVRLA